MARERMPGGFTLAWGFLTALPARHPQSDTPPPMQRALPWFPLVGALLGGIVALEDIALAFVFPLGIRNVIVIGTMALLTGMLHLDGFIDCCDALLGTRPIARRLEILRDSRVGAYGVIGAVLVLLLRFEALEVLTPPLRAALLIVAPTLGRWGMVAAIVRYPYARAQGAGSGFAALGRHLVAASAVAIVIITSVFFIERIVLAGIAAAVVALISTFGWSRWVSGRLGGGLTGDTYGALNELVEVAVLAIVPALAALQR